jgi:probable rRNA maturation factor
MPALMMDNSHGYPIDAAQLERRVARALHLLEMSDSAQVGVALVDNFTIQQMNRDYRAVDAPTDILSFPTDIPDELLDEIADDVYLGDLVIAYPYVEAQAAQLGHTMADTLALLLVHGLLHLVGYTHDTPQNKAQMWAEQARLLTALGVDIAIVPALEAQYTDAPLAEDAPADD